MYLGELHIEKMDQLEVAIIVISEQQGTLFCDRFLLLQILLYTLFVEEWKTGSTSLKSWRKRKIWNASKKRLDLPLNIQKNWCWKFITTKSNVFTPVTRFEKKRSFKTDCWQGSIGESRRTLNYRAEFRS